MANEVVKYDNFMNSLSFIGFETNDFNFLMAICARMRDLGEDEQTFNYDYLMELINWDKTQNIDLFHKELKRMNGKLLSINGTVDINPDEFVSFNLFQTFSASKRTRLLTVRVNKDFKFILNNITNNFTRLELKEYVSLDGRYPKQLYAQIKQRYKQRGHFWQPTVDELRQALSIPNTYTTKRIYTLILEPAVRTLKSCKGLGELELEVIKERRRGNPVKGYRFTWKASGQIKGQMSFDDFPGVNPTEKREKVKTKKTSGNNFNDFKQNDITDWDAYENAIRDN